MTKKVKTKLDLSKVPYPGCISVLVLKTCKPEISYILAEFFNMCLKDCWEASAVALAFKNVGDRFTAKNYHPVSLLFVVSKVFKNL